MGMHNNFYWHRMLQEDTTYGQPCAEVALAELRAHIYRVVLTRRENLVNEYGRSPWEPIHIAGVGYFFMSDEKMIYFCPICINDQIFTKYHKMERYNHS